jgi:ABC-type branched-subunit amino acid transport system ATPase component
VRSLPSYKIAKLGIGLVPEGRQIFPNLTVYENLVAASGNRLAIPIPGPSTKSTRCFRGSPSAAATWA